MKPQAIIASRWRVRRALRAVVCSAALAAAPLPAAAECGGAWLVHQMAKAKSVNVVLRDNRRTVATIPRLHLLHLDIINKSINTASGVDAQLLLCSSPRPNAHAWSEGRKPFVALTLGMYRLLGEDWDAYAAILGHENAHLVRRHGSKRQARETAAALGAQLLGTSLLAGKSRHGGALIYESITIGKRAITSSYSREEEHEADKLGMRYAHAAGFNPRGALSFHAKMKNASHFLSSHPSSGNRLRRLKAELKRKGW